MFMKCQARINNAKILLRKWWQYFTFVKEYVEMNVEGAFLVFDRSLIPRLAC